MPHASAGRAATAGSLTPLMRSTAPSPKFSARNGIARGTWNSRTSPPRIRKPNDTIASRPTAPRTGSVRQRSALPIADAKPRSTSAASRCSQSRTAGRSQKSERDDKPERHDVVEDRLAPVKDGERRGGKGERAKTRGRAAHAEPACRQKQKDDCGDVEHEHEDTCRRGHRAECARPDESEPSCDL